MRNHVCQFSEKIDNFVFLGPNLPKNGFWSRNFKNLSLHSESTPLRYHVRQFSVKRTTLNFRPKFGEIVQLRAIFWFEYCWGCCRELGGGWNELGGGGWSWVEVEMSWVEVDGAGWSWVELGARFSNTHWRRTIRKYSSQFLRQKSTHPCSQAKQSLYYQ